MIAIKWAESIVQNNSWRASRLFGLTEHFTEREWIALVEECGGNCVNCGADTQLSADHIVPLSRGGKNTIDNIQVLCRRCNSKKALKSIDYRNNTERSCAPPQPAIKPTQRVARDKRSFRLTETADALLQDLAERKGLSKTAVLETLIREEAKREGVPVSTNPPEPRPTPTRTQPTRPGVRVSDTGA